MAKAIAILENNIDFLNVLLNNIPVDELDDTTLILFNDVRVVDLKNSIDELLSNYPINYLYVSSADVNDKLKEEVINTPFVDNYNMSMNILMLWYVNKYLDFESTLYLDDDVILLPGFSNVFNLNTNGFYTHRLCAGNSDFYSESERRINVYNEWFKLFDIEFTTDWWQNIYLKKYINSGQYLVHKNKFDVERYESYLKKLFSSAIIEEDWNMGKVHTSGYIDEIFMTLFFINDDYELINSIVKLYLGIKYASKPTAQTILHLAASSHKYELINWLINNNCITGTIFNDTKCVKTKRGLTKINDCQYQKENLFS